MRLPLAIPLDARNSDETIDARMVNMLVEPYEDKHYVVSRAGLDLIDDQTGAANGVMAFNGQLISLYGATAFKLSETFFGQKQKLLAEDRANSEQFGNAVAISSDGETLAVAAFLESTSPSSQNGAVYVFTKRGISWVQQQKILASDYTSGHQFGISVALSDDGNTLAVGAYLGGVSESGAVYVFTRSSGTWTEQQKLVASDAASSDRLGISVALSADGNTLAAGAYFESTSPSTNNGAVYTFTRSGTAWTQQQKILASDYATGDQFGRSVSLSEDGLTLAVGAISEDTTPHLNNGAAYIFTFSGTWSEQQKVIASDYASNDQFGVSVSLSDDGNTLAVGAFNEGTAPTTSNGAAYVFTRTSGVWSEQQKLLASDKSSGDLFGIDVSLSGDGDTVVVGAYLEDTSPSSDNGAAYVFTRSAGTWTQDQKLLASDYGSLDQFGIRLAISSDGGVVIIGANTESTSPNGNNGAAYVFATARSLDSVGTVTAGTYDFAQTST